MKLEGKVTHIIYKSDNSFKILRLQSQKEKIVVKGVFPYVEVGEYIICDGEYVEHKEYGLQFNSLTFEKKEPEEDEDIIKFLSSEISGVGKVTAKKIVKEFGKDTFNVILENPEKIKEKCNLNSKKVETIHEQYKSKVALFSLSKKLSAFNLGMESIIKVFKTFGEDAENVIKANPYKLLDVVKKINFHEIDKYALKNGFEINAIDRIKAGIKYALNLSLSNGNTYSDKKELIEFIKMFLKVEEKHVIDAIKSLLAEGEITEKDNKIKIYSISYMEEHISFSLLSLLENKINKISKIDEKIKRLEEIEKISLTDAQKRAIKSLNKSSVNIITGGPGTGKTTIIKMIIALAEESRKKSKTCSTNRKGCKKNDRTYWSCFKYTS